MKVRVWIKGADGPSYDFELVGAPRIGDQISIVRGKTMDDGVVEAVTWQLQAIENSEAPLALEADPAGSVTIVHVICRPAGEVVRVAFEAATADVEARAR